VAQPAHLPARDSCLLRFLHRRDIFIPDTRSAPTSRPSSSRLLAAAAASPASAMMLARALGATRVGAFNAGQHRARTAAPSKAACVRCSAARAAAATRASYTQPTWAQRMRASVDVRATGANVVGETKQEEEEEEEGMDESRARTFVFPAAIRIERAPALSAAYPTARPTQMQFGPPEHAIRRGEAQPARWLVLPATWGLCRMKVSCGWRWGWRGRWGSSGGPRVTAKADGARQRGQSFPPLGRPQTSQRAVCVHWELCGIHAGASGLFTCVHGRLQLSEQTSSPSHCDECRLSLGTRQFTVDQGTEAWTLCAHSHTCTPSE